MNLANKLTIFRIILVPIMVCIPFLGIKEEILGIQQIQRVLTDDDAFIRGHENPLGPVDHLIEHVDQILNIVRHLNIPSLP